VSVRRRIGQGQIADTLEAVGAPSLGDRLVRTLSAGQKRRVALAGLLLLAAPLWLLDEPTTNLDAEGQRLVARLIDRHVGHGGLVIAAVHHELAVSGERLRSLALE
jgi:heme exporter protein A